MPRKPKGPDGPDYEPFIENLTEQLDQWAIQNFGPPREDRAEPTHEFARRLVGLMRMDFDKIKQVR